jgi:hypothetical protein
MLSSPKLCTAPCSRVQTSCGHMCSHKCGTCADLSPTLDRCTLYLYTAYRSLEQTPLIAASSSLSHSDHEWPTSGPSADTSFCLMATPVVVMPTILAFLRVARALSSYRSCRKKC